MLPAVYCGLESSALPAGHGQKPVNETGLQRNLGAMLVLQTIENKPTPNQMEWFSEGNASLILHHSGIWKIKI